MARCEICNRDPQVGNNVSFSKRHTKRRFEINVQRTALVENGVTKRLYICSKCLKTLRKQS
jgi:large subunit ribosomal protein L28